MAFCRLSNDFNKTGRTQIDNNFIVEFLPELDPRALKVYLYGLYLCQSEQDHEFSVFEKTFKLEREDVISIFNKLHELNLVNFIEIEPMEVIYLPVKTSSRQLAKYDVNKFKTFNVKAQDLLTRQIDINEFKQYYDLIEIYNMEQEAVVRVIEYCVSKKNDKVTANYILTVLRNWAREGLKTLEDVEVRINNEELYSDDIKLVLTTLGIKRACTMEEKSMFLDWTTNLGFNLEAINHVAKIVKGKKGNIFRLDALLNKCYELNKFGIKEIDDYFAMEDEYFKIAKAVCRNLGVYYDNLSIVVETYVSNWCNLGYEYNALNKLSLYCFTSSIKNLQGLDAVINKIYKLGIITAEAIDIYINELNCFDSEIEKIISAFGLGRHVNKFDREYYNTWVNNWNTNKEVLDYAVEISKDKMQPMQFLNRVLSTFHNKNITTVEAAKQEHFDFESSYKKQNKPASIEKHDYTKGQLSSLFDTINEVELW